MLQIGSYLFWSDFLLLVLFHWIWSRKSVHLNFSLSITLSIFCICSQIVRTFCAQSITNSVWRLLLFALLRSAVNTQTMSIANVSKCTFHSLAFLDWLRLYPFCPCCRKSNVRKRNVCSRCVIQRSAYVECWIHSNTGGDQYRIDRLFLFCYLLLSEKWDS